METLPAEAALCPLSATFLLAQWAGGRNLVLPDHSELEECRFLPQNLRGTLTDGDHRTPVQEEPRKQRLETIILEIKLSGNLISFDIWRTEEIRLVWWNSRGHAQPLHSSRALYNLIMMVTVNVPTHTVTCRAPFCVPSINTVLWGTCHCSQPLTKDKETEEREDLKFEHRQVGSRASAVLPPEGQLIHWG